MFRSPPAFVRRQAAAVLLALGAAVIAACGGGGDAAPAATAAGAEKATAYAAGPISGFGSVIVNGVRFDDSSAAVTDDDDLARSRDLLKLGMMVEVDGAAVSAAAATGRALRIRFGSEIVGPVTTKPDTVAGTLGVLGQTVEVKDTTVFDASLTGGLGGIKVGDVLEVHAQFKASNGHYVATRVESATGATTFKLRGPVADLTAKTFTLGGQLINYEGIAAADLPANFANGLRVRVRMQTKQVNGQWVATAVSAGVRKVDDRADADLRGPITVFGSSAAFEINGMKVNAASAAFPDGMAGIGLGTLVEVHGALVDGVLVATKVELDAKHAMDRHGFELHGAIGALDTTAKTFKLRGVTVSYGGAVAYKGGTAADLANGRMVEVKGTPSADRTQLAATTIGFEG